MYIVARILKYISFVMAIFEDKLTSIRFGEVSLVKKEPKLIVYSRDKNKFGTELEKMIEELGSKANVEICSAISDLTARLRVPLSESAIAVLHIADKKDLKSMLSIQSLFHNMRIILILPDRNDVTIEAGHSLHPRYLSFKDNSLKDIKAVLTRMIEVEKTTYRQIHEHGLSI
jgi:ActR/RegA family two-component response regulator